MRLYDTHCHFETENREEIAAILRRAKQAGVEKLMAVGGSGKLNAAAIAAATVANESGNGGECPKVSLALGFDRDAPVEPATAKAGLDGLLSAAQPGPVAAIGEIGLDYHYSPETRGRQLELFAAQLEAAHEFGLPVVIHTREADDDTVGLLREIPSRGIIHCFTGAPDAARKYLDLGFFISFSGIVTFRAADNVREAQRAVPDDRLLIETDAPFLAPVPLRGQTNEPAFIRHTCEFLARLRNCAAAELAELTFANAERALGR